MDHQEKAYQPRCSACDSYLINKKSALEANAKTLKHKKNIQSLTNKKSQQDKMTNFISDSIRDQASKLEIMICLLMAQKNLPFSIGDHFLHIVKSILPGNLILNLTSLGKTKAVNLIREGMAFNEKL